MGGLVAFFAAQSTETTPEKGYEVTLADGSVVKQNYGVFTHTIFSALAKNPAMTYRQLAQSVLAGYAAGNMLKPTPLFEGQLDAPIFGNEDAVNVAQWPTVVGGDKSLTISAGQLHGLSKGTKLLVLPNPAAADAALDDFQRRASGGVPDDLPEVALSGAPLGIGALLKQAGLAPSTSEALRLLEQGGVRIDGAVLSDKGLKVEAGSFVVQVGKRKFARVTLVA